MPKLYPLNGSCVSSFPFLQENLYNVRLRVPSTDFTQIPIAAFSFSLPRALTVFLTFLMQRQNFPFKNLRLCPRPLGSRRRVDVI